jgi:hypothetical protein
MGSNSSQPENDDVDIQREYERNQRLAASASDTGNF